MEPELTYRAEIVTMAALAATYTTWQRMTPEEATAGVGSNQFKDEAMEADRASERSMMWSVEVSGLDAKWVSEEYGERVFGRSATEGAEPQITVIADGIDGSSNAASDWLGGNYGSIMSIAEGSDPAYYDTLAAGITMFTEGKMLHAMRGGQTTVRDLVNGGETPVQTSQETALTNESVIYIEDMEVPEDHPLNAYFALGRQMGERLRKGDPQIKVGRTGSTAGNIFNVATGRAVADIAATRKGNLELIAEKLLVENAGGVMYALGQDTEGKWRFVGISREKFASWGQDQHIPIMAAANQEIADALLARLNA